MPGEVRQYVATSFCQRCLLFCFFRFFCFSDFFSFFFLSFFVPFSFFSFCDCSFIRGGHTLPQTVDGKVSVFSYPFFFFCLCALFCPFYFCSRMLGFADLNRRPPLPAARWCVFCLRFFLFLCVKVGLTCPVSARRRWCPARRPFPPDGVALPTVG